MPSLSTDFCSTTAFAASNIKLLALVNVGIPVPLAVISSALIVVAVMFVTDNVLDVSLYVNVDSPPNDPPSLYCTCVSEPPGLPAPPPPPDELIVIVSGKI